MSSATTARANERADPADPADGRARQIGAVLTRHGFGYLVSVLGLERVVPFQWGLLGHARRPEAYTWPEHVRLALEELGPAFVKLGQIASTRPDLLSADLQVELARLQDRVPAVPTAAIRSVIESELGRPIEKLFATFEDTPLAAASIGQAHAAQLPDGTEVVVKVRRPGAIEVVEADLELLGRLALTASRRWDQAERYDLVGVAGEFADTLRAELDYVREGRSAERIAPSFAGDPGVHIPRVVWERTTARVLTLERIRGIKIDDLAALDAAGVDRPALAGRATGVLMKMIFEDGFFHADPHPGNFFVEPGGRLGLIDFGMTGSLDDRIQEQLVDVLLALTSRESDRLVDALLDLGVARGRVDRAALQRDLEKVIAPSYGRPLGEIAIGALLSEMLGIIRTYRLALPRDLALVVKTVIMSEGLATRLAPDFVLMTVLAPYAQRLLARRFSPAYWAPRLGRTTMDAVSVAGGLPRRFDRLLRTIERGELEIGMRPTGFEPLLDRFERLANRLVLGIIAAAFISGLAVLMGMYHPAGWEAWAPLAFAVGFLMAALLGVYLAWSILRSGRG